MAGPFTVGMFINLEKDDEQKALRRTAFEEGLLSVDRAQLRGTKFVIRNADGDFLTQGAQYKAKADALKDAGAHLYFGSCRPTLEQLATLPPRPIVIAGMFYADDYATKKPYRDYYGYISYDIGTVNYWYDLLNKMATAIFGSLTGIGVIIDSRIDPTKTPYNAGAKLIYDAISARKPGYVDLIGVDQGQIFQQLKAFKAKYNQGVLLVPAATLTAIGRKKQRILDHIHRREVQLPALYPNRLYPTTTDTTSGGLLSYGVDLGAMYREAGKIAGQLLLGQTVTKGLQLWTSTYPPETVLNYNAAKSVYGYSDTQIAKLVTDAQVDFIISDEE